MKTCLKYSLLVAEQEQRVASNGSCLDRCGSELLCSVPPLSTPYLLGQHTKFISHLQFIITLLCSRRAETTNTQVGTRMVFRWMTNVVIGRKMVLSWPKCKHAIIKISSQLWAIMLWNRRCPRLISHDSSRLEQSRVPSFHGLVSSPLQLCERFQNSC